MRGTAYQADAASPRFDFAPPASFNGRGQRCRRRSRVEHSCKGGHNDQAAADDGRSERHPALLRDSEGSGPALLLIPGAEGDAEEYARVVGLLQGEFTVLSYDRRGFSRSPRPEGYNGTTVEEQADDAAALLEATGLAPATVWGNSSGAIIGLSLVLRHPGGRQRGHAPRAAAVRRA